MGEAFMRAVQGGVSVEVGLLKGEYICPMHEDLFP